MGGSRVCSADHTPLKFRRNPTVAAKKPLSRHLLPKHGVREVSRVIKGIGWPRSPRRPWQGAWDSQQARTRSLHGARRPR